MNIIYLGNQKFHWCSEVHISKTLEEMGHTVLRLQEDEIDAQSVQLITLQNKPDIFLWTRTPNFLKGDQQQMMTKIKEAGIKTVSYHLDLYCGISRENSIGSDPWWQSDFVFQADGDPKSMEIFKSKGINAYWMPPGVYEKECYLGEPREDFKGDVAFVGSYNYHPEWNYRRVLIDWLKNTYKERFKLYPNPSYPVVMGDELNRLFASTKVIIGDSLCMNFKHQNYWSNRIVETPGRGGFIIVPFIKGMENIYKNEENIVWYEFGNFEQLKSLIDYYLVNNDERNKIRLAGHKLAKQHTFKKRLEEVFKIIGVK